MGFLELSRVKAYRAGHRRRELVDPRVDRRYRVGRVGAGDATLTRLPPPRGLRSGSLRRRPAGGRNRDYERARDPIAELL